VKPPSTSAAPLDLAPATPATHTDWRKVVEPYLGSDVWRASAQVVITLGLLSSTFWAMAVALEYSVLATIALAPLAAGLLVRTFILMHDCAHGSLFASRRVTEAIGFITGVITMTPFGQWRRDHALHHASSGDLDRRGHGDVPTWTVREYQSKTPRQQFWYRVIRHPASLLFGGPIHLLVGQRLRGRSKATRDKQITSVWATNAAIVVSLGTAVWLVGWHTVLLVYGLPYYLAGMAGVWLFYVQHQFEDAYWEEHGDWDYLTASLKGSSHLQLPALFRWFTGNIGVHHVHHLAPRIPNYRLQRCHDENPIFHEAPIVTPRTGMAALRLALWNEDCRRLVRFDEVIGN
jgi:omega-6 fatty acid desaturase (delta-12 desaturase)